MGDLKAFFSQNKVKVENLKVVASDCFVDPNTGKPMEWEIKKISAAQNEALQNDSLKTVKGKRGQTSSKLDQTMYIRKLAAFCTVFPNLYDKELQDSYGVYTPEDLLGVMLDAGEYDDYILKVLQHNKFDVGLDEVVEEAKN